MVVLREPAARTISSWMYKTDRERFLPRFSWNVILLYTRFLSCFGSFIRINESETSFLALRGVRIFRLQRILFSSVLGRVSPCAVCIDRLVQIIPQNGLGVRDTFPSRLIWLHPNRFPKPEPAPATSKLCACFCPSSYALVYVSSSQAGVTSGPSGTSRGPPGVPVWQGGRGATSQAGRGGGDGDGDAPL